TLKGIRFSDAFTFSPDGKRLASAGKIWDAQTGRELLAPKGGGVVGAFSPDGKRLAGVGRDYIPTGELTPLEREKVQAGLHLKIWAAQTGQELLSFKGHPDPVSILAFSRDGKRLVTASARHATVKPMDA